ncbi:helix-turn-helix domain-containing protein [Rubrobacter aplysinae]|uniref:helix-turn-helix domain-containing protein n=1 Tax=Rubrobacter aplysinae TaxID=909625 RepID=UPI00064B8ECA|nr:XRE family transcriptional regulator [Rubrobacter aplysinae]
MQEETTSGAVSGGAAEAVSSERLGGRVKALRREAGLTLDGLAERAGVSRAMLSKLERGEKNPTLVVAARVAEGLGVTLTRLIETEERGAVVVIPRGGRRVMRDPQTGFERQAISPSTAGSGVELVYNVIPVGSTSGEFPPHRKGVEEHVVVERGRLRAVLGGEEHVLEAGDAVYFEADVPHRFDNAGEGECGYYLVIHTGGA